MDHSAEYFVAHIEDFEFASNSKVFDPTTLIHAKSIVQKVLKESQTFAVFNYNFNKEVITWHKIDIGMHKGKWITLEYKYKWIAAGAKNENGKQELTFDAMKKNVITNEAVLTKNITDNKIIHYALALYTSGNMFSEFNDDCRKMGKVGYVEANFKYKYLYIALLLGMRLQINNMPKTDKLYVGLQLSKIKFEENIDFKTGAIFVFKQFRSATRQLSTARKFCNYKVKNEMTGEYEDYKGEKIIMVMTGFLEFSSAWAYVKYHAIPAFAWQDEVLISPFVKFEITKTFNENKKRRYLVHRR